MFVTVEGVDGSGKSSVVKSIVAQAFVDGRDDIMRTKEPTETEYGQLIRANMGEDTDPIADFHLFMADRRNHIENHIKPALEEGNTVICDRYADSTRAYQPVALAGESDEKPFDSRWEAKFFIEQTMKHWLLEPDLTVYLDISVDTAIARSSGDEKYEEREFLEEVKANYDALADTRDRIIRIDGEQSKENVRTSVLREIERARTGCTCLPDADEACDSCGGK